MPMGTSAPGTMVLLAMDARLKSNALATAEVGTK